MDKGGKKDIRGKAEERLESNPGILKSFSCHDVERLAHELDTLKIELDLQNEALRKARAELGEARRRYASFFDNSPVPYFTLDRMGCILDVNRKGAELLGKRKNLLLGKSFSSFVHIDDREAFRLHRQMLGDTRTHLASEIRLFIKEKIVHVKIESDLDMDEMVDGGGGPPTTRMTVIDISFIKQAEEEREQARVRERLAREEAEEKEHNRLESLRVLAGGISHDLNNLLVVITVNAELALKKITDPGLRELVEGIDHAARRIGALSAQMLTYSGGMELHKEPVDLSKSAYETAHLLAAALSRKGNLKYDMAEGLPAIEADKSALQQIVVNLLLNAADAIEGYRGNISISTGSVYAGREYLDRARLGRELPQGRYEYLEVRDDGVGMSKQALEKIFEPFYTTKFTGRGMGLASVFGIVREHGGAIEAESAPGKGTRIRVLFPQPDRELELPGEGEKRLAAHAGSGTILLVDDEVDVLNMTQRVLRMEGYNVITAEDGSEAIETFKKHNGEIKAVVIDLIMPDMPGDETSREIRKISPDVPIILLSGYHQIDMDSMKEDFGITALIKKPYRIDAFLEMLQGVMEK